MIVGICFFVLVAGIGGYIIWRINQPKEVTPEESGACAICDVPGEDQTFCKDGNVYTHHCNADTWCWEGESKSEDCTCGCSNGSCNTDCGSDSDSDPGPDPGNYHFDGGQWCTPASGCQGSCYDCPGYCSSENDCVCNRTCQAGWTGECCDQEDASYCLKWNEGDRCPPGCPTDTYDVHFCHSFGCCDVGGVEAERCQAGCGDFIGMVSGDGLPDAILNDPDLPNHEICYDRQKDYYSGGEYVGHHMIKGNPDAPECQDEEPAYLQVQGRVYCQDENGPIYPIPNAAIQFYKHNAGVNEDMTTGEDGNFQSAANTTQLSDGGFAVRLVSIPDGGEIEETGALYADMEGPVLNTTICDQGTCNECGTSYEQCDGLSSGINYGFQWIYSNCGPPPNPDWDIDKVGTPVCYEEGTEAVYIDIEYVIEVTNVAEGGDLEYVRDEYDEKIRREWIISTSPQASQITAEYIQWDIPEGERTFAEGESRQFSYKIRIPLINNKDLLGEQLTNHVVAHLSEGEDIHAYEDILIGCDLPPTGLLDNTLARIALGGILLILGFGSYQMGFLDGGLQYIMKSSGKISKKIKYELSQEKALQHWENKALADISKKRKEDSYN